MPILPLDHPEPLAATLGVMLYPGTGDDDSAKALAYAAQFLLSGPIPQSRNAGHNLPESVLVQIAIDAGHPLTDFAERWEGGLATGELFKALYILAKDNPELASWENAMKIYKTCAKGTRSRSSRTTLLQARNRFLPVAHLWGAWSIRKGQVIKNPEVGYHGYDDFESFLAEAEILRHFGQNWRPARVQSKPPLPPDVWQVPEGWRPPPRQPGWPKTGGIPDIALPEDLVTTLKPPGRPRKPG